MLPGAVRPRRVGRRRPARPGRRGAGRAPPADAPLPGVRPPGAGRPAPGAVGHLRHAGGPRGDPGGVRRRAPPRRLRLPRLPGARRPDHPGDAARGDPRLLARAPQRGLGRPPLRDDVDRRPHRQPSPACGRPRLCRPPRRTGRGDRRLLRGRRHLGDRLPQRAQLRRRVAHPDRVPLPEQPLRHLGAVREADRLAHHRREGRRLRDARGAGRRHGRPRRVRRHPPGGGPCRRRGGPDPDRGGVLPLRRPRHRRRRPALPPPRRGGRVAAPRPGDPLRRLPEEPGPLGRRP